MARSEFAIDGLNVYHFAAEAPRYAILILHGTGGHGGCYDKYGLAHASGGVSVYAMDFPSHGRSRGEQGSWTMSDCLQSIDRVASHIRESTGLAVFLLGSSQGSAFAYFSLNRSEAVTGAITMGLAAFNLSPYQEALAPLRSEAYEKIEKFFRGSLNIDLKKYLRIETDYGSPEVTERLLQDPDMCWTYDLNSYRELLLWQPEVAAADNTRPMLVTVGEHDPFMPPSLVKKVAAQIAGPVTVLEFKDAPHQLMLERTEEFCAAVDSWVGNWL